MDDCAVSDLLALSHALGNDPTLVQAGGGNTSVKASDGQHMFVKASGTTLATMSARQGYRCIRIRPLLDLLADDALMQQPVAEREAAVKERMLAACTDALPGRPSVESPLHAFLGRCVAHVHSVGVNGLLCARDGRKAIERIYAGSLPSLYLAYCDPGLPLARATWRAVQEYHGRHGALPSLIFLENHGLFVTGTTPTETIALVRKTEQRARRAYEEAAGRPCPLATSHKSSSLNPAAAEIVQRVVRRLWGAHFKRTPVVRLSRAPAALAVAARDDAAALLAAGPLTPDQVVYAHGAPLWLEETHSEAVVEKSLAAQLQTTLAHQTSVPRTILLRNLGLVVADTTPSSAAMAEETTVAALESLLIATAFGGPRGLTPAAADYIENWEVERFRRSLAQ